MGHVPGDLVVRACRDRAELDELYLAIGRQFGGHWTSDDRRLEEPRARFDTDRPMMLCVSDGARIRGGVVAFGDEEVTVRAIGIDPEIRGLGIGRRLLELVELQALARGARVLSLGAVEDARGFYDRLGYRGKRTGRQKQLPLPGRVRDRRVSLRLAELGDVLTGVPAQPAEATGSN